jgi:Ribonuclease G/E
VSKSHLFIKGSHFAGKIARFEHALDAFFISYGASQHGLLPIKNIEGYDESVHNEGATITVRIDEVETSKKGAVLSAPKVSPESSVIHDLIETKKSYDFKLIIVIAIISALIYFYV